MGGCQCLLLNPTSRPQEAPSSINVGWCFPGQAGCGVSPHSKSPLHHHPAVCLLTLSSFNCKMGIIMKISKYGCFKN